MISLTEYFASIIVLYVRKMHCFYFTIIKPIATTNATADTQFHCPSRAVYIVTYVGVVITPQLLSRADIRM